LDAAVTELCTSENIEVAGRYQETESGKGFDSLEKRPQLAKALTHERLHLVMAKHRTPYGIKGSTHRVSARQGSEFIPFAHVCSLMVINQYTHQSRIYFYAD
jgi:hypothetical protein